MSPLVRYTAAVLLTLICWRQTLMDGLAGRVDLATAVTRFLIILLVARTAMRFIGNLVDHYRATANLTESAHVIAGTADRTAQGNLRSSANRTQSGDEQ